MQNNPQGNLFGYVDDRDESLQTKDSGVFGLNVKCNVTNFVFNPNSGKDNSPFEAIQLTVSVDGKDYMKTFGYPKVYKNNVELKQGEAGYDEAFIKEFTQTKACIIHIAKALGATEATIKQAISVPIQNYQGWCNAILSTVRKDYNTVPVDVFLQYQWSIKEGQNRTFLELPKNMKGGYWIVPSIPTQSKWTAVKGEKGNLIYQDAAGQKHPFERTSDFMTSNKAIQQNEGEGEMYDNQADQMNAGTSGIPVDQSAPATGTTTETEGTW